MKERTFKSVKSIQAVLLFCVSLFLVSLSFTSFAPWGSIQFWGWFALAFVVASLQIVFIVQLKTAYKNNNKDWKALLGLISGYILFTIITFNGSLSFVVTTIDQKSKDIATKVEVKEINVDQIKENINELKRKNEQMNKVILEEYLPKNYVSSAERLDILVKQNEEEIKVLQKQLQAAMTSDIETGGQEVITKDTFALIAERLPILNMDGDDYQYFIMFLMSLGIEYGLFITAGTISSKKFSLDVTETKKEINKYIDALFNTDGVRLVTDQKISEATKISLKNCHKYRQILLDQIYNGKPLIYTGKGGTRSNFSKEDVIKIITFAINTQKIGE